MRIPQTPQLQQIIFFVQNSDHTICSCNNLNSTILSVLGVSYSWLVDTGATLSVVKYDELVRRRVPYQIERVRINGIGGEIYSEGFVYLDLQHNVTILITSPGANLYII